MKIGFVMTGKTALMAVMKRIVVSCLAIAFYAGADQKSNLLLKCSLRRPFAVYFSLTLVVLVNDIL